MPTSGVNNMANNDSSNVKLFSWKLSDYFAFYRCRRHSPQLVTKLTVFIAIKSLLSVFQSHNRQHVKWYDSKFFCSEKVHFLVVPRKQAISTIWYFPQPSADYTLLCCLRLLSHSERQLSLLWLIDQWKIRTRLHSCALFRDLKGGSRCICRIKSFSRVQKPQAYIHSQSAKNS